MAWNWKFAKWMDEYISAISCSFIRIYTVRKVCERVLAFKPNKTKLPYIFNNQEHFVTLLFKSVGFSQNLVMCLCIRHISGTFTVTHTHSHTDKQIAAPETSVWDSVCGRGVTEERSCRERWTLEEFSLPDMFTSPGPTHCVIVTHCTRHTNLVWSHLSWTSSVYLKNSASCCGSQFLETL